MRRVELAGTGVGSSVLGFGCAGLFSLPRARDRMAVLETAYDSGFRHFDVAPMYGLGLAEAELGALLRRHPGEITVATKFGIGLTPWGRAAGWLQAPVRSALRARPGVQRTVRRSGQGPTSGWVGRLLYASVGFSPGAARRSLERSLRALGLASIDVLLLHDPTAVPPDQADALLEFLTRQRDRGTIRTWGATGPGRGLPGVPRRLAEAAPVIQFRDDPLGPESPAPAGGRPATITFGALGGSLPILKSVIERDPERVARLSARLGADLRRSGTLADLLLRCAMARNSGGVVLFSSSRPERVRRAALAAEEEPTRGAAEEAVVLRELASLASEAGP